jgi:hypothetical protein
MSINLPGNTAGFSADTQPDPGEGATVYKGDGKAVKRKKRRVDAPRSPAPAGQGIFEPHGRKISLF